MKINCIIVDDEALARKGLEKYVKEIGFLDLKGVCKNALEANTILKNAKIELLFLDIEMPMLSGIDFLKSLQFTPKIIFTTAYSEYAIESFDFDVIDYLVKPISFERFLQAANKAHRFISKNMPSIKRENDITREEEYIFIKSDKQLVKIVLKDILLIEAMQNYVRIFTKLKSHIAHVPLKKVLEILPPKDFIQTHKSFVISKSKVESIVGNQILIEGHKVPIGRSLKEEVVEHLITDKVLKK
jgi:DNA-binding LytR/AlgR family response regulator